MMYNNITKFPQLFFIFLPQNYFLSKAAVGVGVTLSFDDFNPQYNMKWDNFPEKEKRGPPYHRYHYYFPIGCQGFGLNIKKNIKIDRNNEDWIQMNGNPNEWRIMYHGTKNHFVKCNWQAYVDYDCQDEYGNTVKGEYGNTVKVGNGIYFSDRISVCLDPNNPYAPYTQIGNK